MGRAVDLGSGARWWPSAIYQTTTLEAERDGQRLLVDPGVAPWEIDDVVAGPDVTEIFLTHADWDHVLGLGTFPGARVTASRGAAGRVASGEAAADGVRQGAGLYVPVRDVEGIRVDRPVDPPAETELGPFAARLLPAPGHTEDGMAAWLAEPGLLVVGDHLSTLEIPFVNHSAWAYRDTLRALADLIDRERPRWVVPGHGRPHDADAAARLAAEDLAYVDALVTYAEGGGDPERPEAVPFAARNPDDGAAHARNVRAACERAAGG